MKNKKYKKFKSIVSSTIIILVVVFLIGFFIFTNWKINKRRADLSATIFELEKEVKIMEEKNKELKELKEKTESNEYIEEVAREQLELKKPGEEVFVVQKEPASVEDSGVTAEEKNWWEKIKSIWTR